jgi:hypothetical protein
MTHTTMTHVRSAVTTATSVLIVALALAGCASESVSTGTVATQVAATPGFVPGVPQGFQCPLVPNGFDPAGSIYRLDKSGTYYRVKDYSSDPAIKTMPGYKRDIQIANYVLSDKQTSSAGMSFEILKNALPGLSASGSGDFKKDVAVDIVVEDMRAEVIDDQVADTILERFKTEIKIQPGSKYYLVREAVRAGAVSYAMKREDVAKIGGQAQMETLAQGKANVTFKDDGGLFAIKQTFTPDRIAVCVKPAEIVAEAARGGQPASVTLKSPEETTMPAIKKVAPAAVTAQPAAVPAPPAPAAAAPAPAPQPAAVTVPGTTAVAPVAAPIPATAVAASPQ